MGAPTSNNIRHVKLGRIVARAMIAFFVLGILSLLLRWNLGDCGYVSLWYKMEKTEGLFNFRDPSIEGLPDCVLGGSHDARGYPAYYITSYSPSVPRSFWGRSGNRVFFPSYMVINALWMAAVSFAISLAIEKARSRKHPSV